MTSRTSKMNNQSAPSPSFTHRRLEYILQAPPAKIRFISVVAIENRCYQFNAGDVVALMNKCILRKFPPQFQLPGRTCIEISVSLR